MLGTVVRGVAEEVCSPARKRKPAPLRRRVAEYREIQSEPEDSAPGPVTDRPKKFYSKNNLHPLPSLYRSEDVV